MRLSISLILSVLFGLQSFAQPWTQVTKALPTPFTQSLPDQFFGYSVAIDGNYAVVGAFRYEDVRGAAFVLEYDGTNWVNIARLRHLSRDVDDRFGFSVDISGDNIVVGAYREGIPFPTSGFAYVFTKPASGWTDMTETARLEASDPAVDDYFGISVGISGDNIVVGAHFDDDGGSASGSAYVFTKSGSQWTSMSETGKLTASDAAFSDKFGSSVSISGDVIVVGAPEDDDDGSNSGSVYLFKKPASGWTNMTQTAKLKAGDANGGDFLGNSIEIENDQIIVGANYAGTSGSAYIFEKPGTGWVNMIHNAKLSPSDGAANDIFGQSVSISGGNAVVGSYQDDDAGSASGSAYVFTKVGASWTSMNETAKITASDAAAGDAFGVSVGISGDNIISGASGGDIGGQNAGAVYLFKKPVSGWITSNQTQKLIPPTYVACPTCLYGWSVSIDGNYAVAGAPNYQGNGKAFVLFYNGVNWINQAELTASDGALNDRFGESVSISGNTIAIGAMSDDDNGLGSGSAYVYTKTGSSWANMTETAKLIASDGTSYDQFGRSISISGDIIAVGADRAGISGNELGAVYVYSKPGASWMSMFQTAKLTASDGANTDLFGNSVSVSGNSIAVGCWSDDDNGSFSGSAYIFEKSGANWTNMNQTAKLKPSDGASNDYFGYSVSISGDDVVVGAYNDDDNLSNSGSAYVFTKPVSGWANMFQTAKLNPTDGSASAFDFFGRSVSISGNKIAVAASGDSDNYDERGSGSAYIFEKPVSGWNNSVQSTRIRANPPRAVQDNLGWSIGLSGSKLIVGTYRTDFLGDASGSAFFFNEGCNTNSILDISACNSYTSPSGNYIWTNSNTYVDTIPNNSGCDSIIIINLTINSPVSGIDNRTECDSYTWIDGNTYTSSNNTASFNIVGGSANGCDSLVTLNLTIVNSSTGTDVRSECSPFTWIDGNTYTADNNTATFNIIGGADNGCDSIVTLDLTIIQPATSIDSQQACGSFTWIDGVTYTASNNTATYTISGAASNGCDSIVTLDLVLTPDNTPPTPDIATLADVTSECEVTFLTAPSATDNCAGAIIGMHNATLPITTQGMTVVTWTYDDGHGNTSNQTQNVVIDDITAPTPDIATLADVASECEVLNLTDPTATDNCAGLVTVTNNATLPITAQGTTVVTWTYDDGHGNTSSQTQNVVIDDITAPTPDIATLADVTSECEVLNLIDPTATDNCAGLVTVTNNATLPITAQGTTVVTWTYDDGHGNTSSQTQNVVIDDITAPTPDIATLADVTSECEVLNLTDPTATDNCVGLVTVTNNATLPITAHGTTVVTWTYDDGNSNTSSQTQNVVITPIDNSITQVDNITLSADAPGYSYQWVDCNNGNAPITGETNQTFIASGNGSYAVIIDNGDCSVTSNCVDITAVGLDILEIQTINVFPNPTSKTVTINSSAQFNAVEVVNMIGKVEFSASLGEVSTYQIVLPKAKGVYFVKVSSDFGTRIFRVIKN